VNKNKAIISLAVVIGIITSLLVAAGTLVVTLANGQTMHLKQHKDNPTQIPVNDSSYPIDTSNTNGNVSRIK
jgi:hypothetical protein